MEELTKFPLRETHLNYFPKRNKIISIKRVDGLSASNGGGGGDVGVVGLKGTQELGEDEDEDGIGMKKEVVGCLLLLQESLESL